MHPVNPSLVPSVEDAIQMYTDAGGTITLNSSFGVDPLASSDALINQRETEFTQNNPSFDDIYSNVINGDGSLMAAAVLSFINITRNLVPGLLNAKYQRVQFSLTMSNLFNKSNVATCTIMIS